MEAKIYEYSWESMGYGRGVLLVAANNREEADEQASFENKHWVFDCERNNIAYKGDISRLPKTVVECHYQE